MGFVGAKTVGVRNSLQDDKFVILACITVKKH